MFLEALLSARKRIYISWQGRRTTDHEVKPPSVLVAQLMDYLNAVWTREGGLACEAQLQPLQAFSPKYFTKNSGFTTYAEDWQRALQSAAITHTSISLQTAAPPLELTIQDLKRLLRQPVEVFLTKRLHLHLDQPEDTSVEEEPFSIEGLEKYQLNLSVVQANDAEQTLTQLHLSGRLPLAGFGQIQKNTLLRDCEKLREQFNELLPKWPYELGVQSSHWQLGNTRLSAEWANTQTIWRTNTPKHESNTHWLQVILRPGSVVEGKKGNKQPRLETLINLWLDHLAACASGTPTYSIQIGFDATIKFEPITAETAKAYLEHLCDAYLEAFLKPVPVAAKTACAYLMGVYEGSKNPMEKAYAAFNGTHQKQGEYQDSPALQRVFNSFEDIEMMLKPWAERLYEIIQNSAKVICHSENNAVEDDE